MKCTKGSSLDTTGQTHHRLRVGFAGAAAALLIMLAWCYMPPVSTAATAIRILPSGDAIELTPQDEAGVSRITLPIRRSGDIRYFAAGVGLEEREAEYPLFPLKIILIAKGGAYLSHVSITIRDKAGTVSFEIPEEHVTGPWVFVDLPTGRFDVFATREGERKAKRGISVHTGAVRAVYFRWP